jgi:hypothetical protein
VAAWRRVLAYILCASEAISGAENKALEVDTKYKHEAIPAIDITGRENNLHPIIITRFLK